MFLDPLFFFLVPGIETPCSYRSRASAMPAFLSTTHNLKPQDYRSLKWPWRGSGATSHQEGILLMVSQLGNGMYTAFASRHRFPSPLWEACLSTSVNQFVNCFFLSEQKYWLCLGESHLAHAPHTGCGSQKWEEALLSSAFFGYWTEWKKLRT